MKTFPEALLDACAEFRAAARDWSSVQMFFEDVREQVIYVTVPLEDRDLARATEWAADRKVCGWRIQESKPVEEVPLPGGTHAMFVSALGPSLVCVIEFRRVVA